MASDCDDNKVLPDLVLDIDNDDEETVVPSQQDDHLCSDSAQSITPECLTAGTSQHNNMFIYKQPHCDDQKLSKLEGRSTPRRTHLSNCKGNNKSKQSGNGQSNLRLCDQHTFLTDITEVRQMEQGLFKLLDDFHSGKLQAFGKDSTFEKMEQVREQQEKLARLHFELNAQQEIYGPQSDEGRSMGRENLWKLMDHLRQLSSSIEQLQISSPSVQTDV